LAGLVTEAHMLIEGLPVTITEKQPPEASCHLWLIDSSEVDTIKYTAYSEDALLDYTKDAVEVYQRHLAKQAILDEAKTIVAACPAIKIRSNGGISPWHVFIDEPDIYDEWAYSPAELLERVKEAKATYEKWLAEQETLDAIRELP
jgi:hypothetical protein